MKPLMSGSQLKTKLYCIIFIVLSSMGFQFLIGWFGFNTLSSLRAFVGAESLYSKASDAAVLSLLTYAGTHENGNYQDFLNHVRIPVSFRKVRVELEKRRPDPAFVRQEFIAGGVHPADIDGMISVFKRFRRFDHVHRAIEDWTLSDSYISELLILGEELNRKISAGNDHPNERPDECDYR